MLNRIYTIARYTTLETVRQRVPMALVLFGVLITVGALFLGQISVRQEGKILMDFGLAAIDLFGAVIVVFLGTDLISKEIQRKSLYPLLAKPLLRHELIFGRYLGLMVAVIWNVGLMGAALMVVLVLKFGTVQGSLWIAVLGIVFSLTLLAAISVLFSSTSSPMLAMMLTLAALFIGRQSDILRNVNQANANISEDLARTVYFALPNFRYLDFKDAVVYGDGVPAAVLGTAGLYVGLYSLALLVVAALLFRSRDLT